ncbi:MAG TPA: hypothetical protein EYH40_04270 [Desulfurococcales archaeon]|nr:hypothetical protein [Desulfurococcales archaeon]
MNSYTSIQSPTDMLIYGYKILLKNPNTIAAFILTESITVTLHTILAISLLVILGYYRIFNIIPYIVEGLREGNISVLYDPIVLNPIRIILSIVIPLTIIITSIISAFIYSGLYPFLDRILSAKPSSLYYLFENSFNRWRSVFKVYLTMYILVLAPLTPGATIICLVLHGLIPFKLVELGVKLLIIGFGFMAILFLILLFTPIIAVLKGKGVIESIHESILLVRRGLKYVVLYIILLILVYTMISTILIVSGYLSITLSSIISAVFTLILNPILTLYLLSVYKVLNGRSIVLPMDTNLALILQFTSRIVKLFKTSLRAITNRGIVVYILIALLLFMLGFTYGTYIVSRDVKELIIKLGILVPSRMETEFTVYNKLFLSIDIFFHNWKAVLGSSIAGFAYTIPSVVSLVFNGLIVGSVITILEFTPSINVFISVIPHSIIEIPTFIMVSAFGIKLGIVVYKYSRSRAKLDDVVNSYRELLSILLLSILLFLVAGIIEANIVPTLIKVHSPL